MSHTVAIRLSDPLVKQVRQWAKLKKKTRSEIIREALLDYFERSSLNAQKDPYQTLVALMPFQEGGAANLASESETILRQKFHARSRPR